MRLIFWDGVLNHAITLFIWDGRLNLAITIVGATAFCSGTPGEACDVASGRQAVWSGPSLWGRGHVGGGSVPVGDGGSGGAMGVPGAGLREGSLPLLQYVIIELFVLPVTVATTAFVVVSSLDPRLATEVCDSTWFHSFKIPYARYFLRCVGFAPEVWISFLFFYLCFPLVWFMFYSAAEWLRWCCVVVIVSRLASRSRGNSNSSRGGTGVFRDAGGAGYCQRSFKSFAVKLSNPL